MKGAAAAALMALCAGALAAGLEGAYTVGPRGEATIRVAKGKEQGTFVGILVQAQAIDESDTD